MHRILVVNTVTVYRVLEPTDACVIATTWEITVRSVRMRDNCEISKYGRQL